MPLFQIRAFIQTPDYLYKIISEETWVKSQGKELLKLTAFDDLFIHLATKNQVEHVIKKFWQEAGCFFVLKIETTKLLGKCVLEANPWGQTLYYHLYDGAIPFISIQESLFFKSVSEFNSH